VYIKFFVAPFLTGLLYSSRAEIQNSPLKMTCLSMLQAHAIRNLTTDILRHEHQLCFLAVWSFSVPVRLLRVIYKEGKINTKKTKTTSGHIIVIILYLLPARRTVWSLGPLALVALTLQAAYALSCHSSVFQKQEPKTALPNTSVYPGFEVIWNEKWFIYQPFFS